MTTIGAWMDARWEADKAKFTELRESGRLEDHDGCRKHYVVRGVPKSEFDAVARALDYVQGDRSYWNVRRTEGGQTVFDFESVYQATGGPRERCKRPWDWCGETVLFADWQATDRANRAMARAFRAGQAVRFTAKGVTHHGLVASANARTVSVVVPGSGRWRVPPSKLVAE